jgi:hypothetical protein
MNVLMGVRVRDRLMIIDLLLTYMFTLKFS